MSALNRVRAASLRSSEARRSPKGGRALSGGRSSKAVIVIVRVLPRPKRVVNMRLGDITIPDALMRFMHRWERRHASGRKSNSSRRSPEHGMATIWDADVLIWAASQIVHARDAGLRTSRLMAATPYEIPHLRRPRRRRTRLPASQGRPRPAPVDHGRDLDPAAGRASPPSLLLDQ